MSFVIANFLFSDEHVVAAWPFPQMLS